MVDNRLGQMWKFRLSPFVLLACLLIAASLQNFSQSFIGLPSTPVRNDTAAVNTDKNRAGTEVSLNQGASALLKVKCVRCHRGKSRSGGLALDTAAGLISGGDSGPAIDFTNPAESLILKRIADSESPMPPEGAGLTEYDIALLEEWVTSGATFPDHKHHWALQPLATASTEEGVSEIDTILAMARESRNIESRTVTPLAPRSRQILRAYIDLTGFPPTPQQLRKHLNNKKTEWYANLVDSLLKSDRFGERWAQLWLDQVRYADSDGFEKDLVRPDAWRFRKWVIDALNQNLPFDQFSLWQIAGDALPGTSLEHQVATGFLRCAPANREGGTDPEKNQFEQNIDRLDAIATVWLNISLKCARCHDHPYEPVSQVEYYELLAFFDNCENHTIMAPVRPAPDLEQRINAYRTSRKKLLQQWKLDVLIDAWESKLKYTSNHYGEDNGWDNQWLRLRIYIDNAKSILFRTRDERTIQEQDQFIGFFLRESDDVYPIDVHSEWQLPKALEAFDNLRSEFQFDQAMVVRTSEKRLRSRVRERGDFYRSAQEVAPDFPAVLTRSSRDTFLLDRRDLAGWLFEDCQCLTARVAVNRIWSVLFGRGFINDTADFGVLTPEPEMRALLDWCASELIRTGWDIKWLIRTIMISEAYRLDSTYDVTLARLDPSNQLHLRQKRVKLSGEELRDRILHVGGLLNDSGGYRSFFPPQPFGVDRLSINPNDYWQTTFGRDQWRRSLYIHRQRTSLFPFLELFGSPSGNEPCTARRQSISPLQSLAVLNDELTFESARAVAEAACSASKDDDVRLRLLWERLFCTIPTEREASLSSSFLQNQQLLLRRDPTAILAIARVPGDEEQAAWIMLARGLMNTDRFLRRE